MVVLSCGLYLSTECTGPGVSQEVQAKVTLHLCFVGATLPGCYGRLCHWTLQDTYYIRPHYQDTESKQLYLMHRNKHKEAAKTRRQRNIAQMKEQIKTSEKELSKIEISNSSDAEFQTLFTRMLKELSEEFNSIKKIQSETKNTLIEIKNNLQGNNSTVDEVQNQINDLEHKEEINSQSEQNEETRF